MDTLVLDIETKNTFGDVGGKQNLLELQISAVCLYSYAKDSYDCFTEHELEKVKKILAEPARLIGLSSNKFDIPLLNHHLHLDLFSYPRIDLSDEIELRTGRLIGLNDLAKLNLGEEKLHANIMAKELYNEGKIEELKRYCAQDVMLTKRLYDHIKKEKNILIPPSPRDPNGKPIKIEIELASDLLI